VLIGTLSHVHGDIRSVFRDTRSCRPEHLLLFAGTLGRVWPNTRFCSPEHSVVFIRRRGCVHSKTRSCSSEHSVVLVGRHRRVHGDTRSCCSGHSVMFCDQIDVLMGHFVVFAEHSVVFVEPLTIASFDVSGTRRQDAGRPAGWRPALRSGPAGWKPALRAGDELGCRRCASRPADVRKQDAISFCLNRLTGSASLTLRCDVHALSAGVMSGLNG
jgi:hypothetical protein